MQRHRLPREERTKILREIFDQGIRSDIFAHNVDTINRRIYLVAPVGADKEVIGDNGVECFIKGMDLLNSLDDTPINLILNCPGGCVVNGIAIYDYITASNAPVNVAIYGEAASMGVIISQAAKNRSISQNSMIMLHNLTMGLDEKRDDETTRNYADYISNMQRRVYGILKRRTGNPADFWREEFRKDKYISAKEALGLNLVDGIIPEAKWRRASPGD